jgi:hypothetical protein
LEQNKRKKQALWRLARAPLFTERQRQKGGRVFGDLRNQWLVSIKRYPFGGSYFSLSWSCFPLFIVHDFFSTAFWMHVDGLLGLHLQRRRAQKPDD